MLNYADTLIIMISIALFIATEYFFPIREDDQTARNQKHFWSIMLFILSTLIGYEIKSAFETKAEIKVELENVQKGLQTGFKQVSSIFGNLTNRNIQEKFQEIFSVYHQNFDHSKSPLKDWAIESLDSMYSDMSTGFISLPRELAAGQIGKIYPVATETIIATNVGDTEFYFSNPSYILSNQAALNRQITIIRFYLFSHDEHKMGNFRAAAGKSPIQQFADQVKKLHGDLRTMYSVVIDADTLQGDPRDILIMDNRFLAETKLHNKDWERLRALASEHPERLKEAGGYFRTLRGEAARSQSFMMTNEEMRNSFPKYKDEFKKMSGKQEYELAKKMYEKIMDQLTGPM